MFYGAEYDDGSEPIRYSYDFIVGVRLPPHLLAAVVLRAGVNPGTKFLMGALCEALGRDFGVPCSSDSLMARCTSALLKAEWEVPEVQSAMWVEPTDRGESEPPDQDPYFDPRR